MKSIIRPISSVWLAMWFVVGGVVFAGGCSELVNPFLDELPATSEVSTASVVGVRQASAPAAMRKRDFETVYAASQDGTVSHWPLWWEDPFVDKGSEDGQFAWTWEDYVAFPYGLGRSLVNTMGWPVSVAMTPPFTVMGSDGVLSRQALGYDHDATRLPGGLAPPIDVLEVGTIPQESPPSDSGPIAAETVEETSSSE